MVRCGAGGGLRGVGMREWQAGSSVWRRHDSATAVSRGHGVGGKAGGGEGRGVGSVCRPTQYCGPSPLGERVLTDRWYYSTSQETSSCISMATIVGGRAIIRAARRALACSGSRCDGCAQVVPCRHNSVACATAVLRALACWCGDGALGRTRMHGDGSRWCVQRHSQGSPAPGRGVPDAPILEATSPPAQAPPGPRTPQ